jgi:hypothetical protein
MYPIHKLLKKLYDNFNVHLIVKAKYFSLLLINQEQNKIILHPFIIKINNIFFCIIINNLII